MQSALFLQGALLQDLVCSYTMRKKSNGWEKIDDSGFSDKGIFLALERPKS
jgi:hypothetical protein